MRTLAARWPLFLLVIALTLAAGCTDTPAPITERAPSAPEPIGPKGVVTLPFSFSWKPVPGDSWIYRVTVTDAAERLMFERDIRVTSCNPSKELRGMLADHATFTWTVAVMSSDGTKVLARSAPVSFSVK